MQEIFARLGSNLIYLRAKYGMSRKTLAKLMGIPLNRLCRVEAGDVTVRMYGHHLRRLAEVFGVTSDALLTEELSCEEGCPEQERTPG